MKRSNVVSLRRHKTKVGAKRYLRSVGGFVLFGAACLVIYGFEHGRLPSLPVIGFFVVVLAGLGLWRAYLLTPDLDWED